MSGPQHLQRIILFSFERENIISYTLAYVMALISTFKWFSRYMPTTYHRWVNNINIEQFVYGIKLIIEINITNTLIDLTTYDKLNISNISAYGPNTSVNREKQHMPVDQAVPHHNLVVLVGHGNDEETTEQVGADVV